MRTGEIVVIRYRKGLKIGSVREVSAGKVKIGIDRTKTVSVPRENVLIETAVEASTQGEIDRFAAAVESQAASLDLAELWELLADEKRAFSFDELADLLGVEANAPSDRAALLFHLESESNPHFLAEDGAYRAASAEAVAREQERAQRAAAESREDDELRRWLAGDATADISLETLTARQRSWLDRVRSLVVEGDEWPQASKLKAFLEEGGIRNTSPRALFHLLVRRGIFSPHEHLDLARLNVPVDFEPEARDEAEAWQPSIAISEPHRRDLTSLDVFSVDDETTTDIDDAFSLERLDSTWRVGIHITDLTRAVPPGSALDREASRRVISHYFPERKIGMLPPPLSDDRGSLVEGEARPALSLLVELDDEGTIVAREWTLSTIKSRYRMSYDKVERVLEAVETNEAEASHPLAPALATLLRFAEKRRQLRVESGAVEIDRADLEIRVREDGEIEVELRKSDTKAQSIVSELMILYNVEAARYASENNIPVLYRAQAKIREEARAESARAPHPALRRSILLRAASPPDWTAEPAPHGFLGVDLYTHASSPLRRYVDLLIQRQIVAHLEHGEPAHDREAVSTILYETEERLRELRYLEANRRQYWLLQYLKRRMDEDFDAVVLENNERFALVELTDLGMRAPANLRSGSTPGTTVRVRLAHIDPFDGSLKLVED